MQSHAELFKTHALSVIMQKFIKSWCDVCMCSALSRKRSPQKTQGIWHFLWIKRLCSTGIFVPSVAFSVRIRLAFKANDSSYACIKFKILIGKVVAKLPEFWEQTRITFRRSKHFKNRATFTQPSGDAGKCMAAASLVSPPPTQFTAHAYSVTA